MSVVSFVPQVASTDAIESIFAPKPEQWPQKPGASEVIYTLASAVQRLEGNIAEQQGGRQGSQRQQQQAAADRAAITAALTQPQNNTTHLEDPNQTHHLDGQPSQISVRVPNSVRLAIEEVTRRFRPYNIPPAPVPMDETARNDDGEAAVAEAAEEMQAQDLEAQIEGQDGPSATRRVILTIHEDAGMHTRKFFTHKTPLIHIQDPEQYQEQHQQQLQEEFQETDASSGTTTGTGRVGRRRGHSSVKERELRRRKMYTISVKRQRRLKMKKHKYKKLMRKTRNLRRRLDKL